MLIEDTFGIHKGTPPRQRRRLVLQVEYSTRALAGRPCWPQAVPLDGYDSAT